MTSNEILTPHTVSTYARSVFCRRDSASNQQPAGPASLERLVLRALAANIQEWCPWLLQALGPDHLSVTLEELSLDLPLKFCIKSVPDGFYWRRRALAAWPDPDRGMCDVDQHGGSWRQLVLERHVQTLLEKVIPSDELPGWLKIELRDAAPYVKRLILRELRAGIVAKLPGHLLLGPVLLLLPELQELQIKIGPRDCGLDFDWTKFTLSTGDAQSLATGLLSCMNLVALRLRSSHVSDETLSLMLTENAELLPRLSELDLSHNELQDNSANVIAAFLRTHPALLRLKLTNNRLGAVGAENFAASLDTGFAELDLSLNALGEVGGVALAKNCSHLKVLRLAGCALGPETVQAFCRVLPDSKLHTLDLSNNFLGEESGEQLFDTIQANKDKIHLKQIDLRMTGTVEDTRQMINEILY